MAKHKWTSLAAFVLLLFFAALLDGLMDALGPAGFATVAAVVMGTARGLIGAADKWDGQ